ncbi:hypothetical protein SAZ10_02975 [Mesorhizobium sp. BAC0120]|uniref:hypothetical protein n=1 Tax=Mesorhizobium sp. BAC0120 TaxID=3090670 RepID=UPI00298D089F|nr:hypothetical protein [Mesorhizobium sp. BAC0120]MDW6020719.1 hypothetical protein [Mesorhizobium sp. BAC0120]
MNRRTLIGYLVLAFCLLPAWAVKSATTQSRISWTGAILFFAFIVIVGSLVRNATSPESLPGPDFRRYQPFFMLAVGLSFLAAELLAIAFTYAESGVGLAGRAGVVISQIGSTHIPVVSKYATAMEPPLSPTSLFRVQSIVTVFMIAGLLTSIAYILLYWKMSVSERLQLYQWGRQKRPSNALVFGSFTFALLMALAAIFGGSEFGEPTPKFCLVQAVCYARGDDLLVFAAALAKVVAVFGFPLGAFALYDANRVLPDSNSANL